MRDNGPMKGVLMAWKRHTPEQIIGKLREAEVTLAGGQTVAQTCRAIGVSEQTFYRWRTEYGGLRRDQVSPPQAERSWRQKTPC